MNVTKRNLIARLSLFAAVAGPGLSFGALIDRGGGLIYDTDRNVTWLANVHYGAGSSYDTADGYNDGRMSWQNAINWAANLSYYDSVRNVTYADWRLPTTLVPDASCENGGMVVGAGYNCTGGELGHLFYNELGGLPIESIHQVHNSNYDLFTIAEWVPLIWSSTEYSPNTEFAWTFDISDGFQVNNLKSDGEQYYTAWAVRDGDIAPEVPVPAAAWLFISGALGLTIFAAKKRA